MNQLQYEKSPYLLQHADNPVDWRPWSPEVFADARRQDKPVFLSIGYSTCHWCHVMARESFEAEEVAQLLNWEFLSVKVDREERPDVDAVYMGACVAMNGAGGWPLTVLLTPEQKPFWAGTYLPREQLLSLLEQAARLWREDRTGLTEMGERLTEALRQEEPVRPNAPARSLVERGAESFSRLFDPQWGGFGRPPKFPSPHILLFLFRYAQAAGDEHAREMGLTTLEGMYRGGLFDHVGGGFSRYATDRRWLIPHFEKMLYDNALLAMAYTEGYRQAKRPYLRYAARRTLDYMFRELRDPTGGFFCGQDADSEGVEGKYYVFTPEELTRALGPEAEEFCARFGVTAQGNFHGRSIPNLTDTPDWARLPEELAVWTDKLYRYRRERTALHRDDKVLTAWNGLAIAALARGGLVLEEPRYLTAAQAAAGFLRQRLTDQQGRLLARWREGEAASAGKLEDYAFYAWGLLELYQGTFRAEYLEEAQRMAEILLEDFFDRENGGFYPYGRDGEQLIARKKETYDGAMPSGNAVAAWVLFRLDRLTGETRWRTAAEKQLRYLAGAARENPAGHGFTLLTLTEALWPEGELVCAARETPEALFALLRERPALAALVKTTENQERLAAAAPFTQAYPIPESGARYYLCQNGSCRQPAETLAELEELLPNPWP